MSQQTERQRRHRIADESRERSLLGPKPLMCTVEEAYLYCRQLLGIGRPAFDRHIRPQLCLYPICIDRNRLTHFRVHVPSLEGLIERLVERSLEQGITYAQVRALRRWRGPGKK